MCGRHLLEFPRTNPEAEGTTRHKEVLAALHVTGLGRIDSEPLAIIA